MSVLTIIGLAGVAIWLHSDELAKTLEAIKAALRAGRAQVAEVSIGNDLEISGTYIFFSLSL